METLNKFGVPLGGGQGRTGLFQPKMKNRWRVRVVNFGPIQGGLELTQQLQSVTKPKLSHEEVPVHSYNSIAYYAGKHQWDTITLVVRDDLTNTVSRLVGHQMQKQMNHFEQTAFAAGVNYKFTTYIEVMDGGNDVVVETWTLEGCFIQAIDYSDLEFSDSQYQTITMTIRFDNATQADGLMPLIPDMIQGVRL